MIKRISTFLSHFSVFDFEKQPKNLNFTSNRPFGGYFQWNLCIYFQKICSRRRYSDAKLIENILNFLVALLRFWFIEKRPKNLNFTSNRPFGGYFQWNACIYFQKICSWRRYSDAKLIENILNLLVALLRFWLIEKQRKNLNF